MKRVREKVSGIAVCLFELVIGVLLIISPVSFTSGILMTFGIVLIACGLVSIVNYFRTEAALAAQGQLLVKGLVALLVGGFCVLHYEWFIATFPILTMIYGIAILLSGLGKIQWAVDMLRLKKPKWYMAAISALISIVCGIVIITSPFSSTAALWMFTGISLIVEAVFDMVTLCVDWKDRKKTESTVEEDSLSGEETEEAEV